MVTRRPIDLSPAGPDWLEWSLSPYGRATSFRLITPSGEALTASEIAAARADALDYGYAISRARALEDELSRVRGWCTSLDAERIREALRIIEAALPSPSPLHRAPRLRIVTST